ncbi:MAG: thermonuclease family protein [Actinomycetota bacterium]|nr:thermonuclease family protein [Actinomycetota bacterium]
MPRHHVAPIPVLGLALALLVAGCGGSDDGSEPGTATVTEIIDGDTIVASIGGTTENVRLVGIDTPETHHPEIGAECFGEEATDRIAELIPEGSEVVLLRPTETRDDYGRLLAWVVRPSDDLLVNLSLVADGYADILIIQDDLTFEDDLRSAATAARAADLGLWGACGGPDEPA